MAEPQANKGFDLSQLPAPNVGAIGGPSAVAEPPKAGGLIKNKGQIDVGPVAAFFNPLPNELSISNYGENYKPDYEPTWGEELAAALSPVATIRHLEEAQSIRRARAADPELAKKLEFEATGKNIGDTELVLKEGAAIAETALTLLPFFKAGKAGMVGAELAAKTGIRTLVKETGKASALGALYGGLYGLHAYDGDWERAVENAAWGAGLGAAGMGFMKTLGFIGRGAGNAISPTVKNVLGGVVATGRGIKAKAEEILPSKLYSSLFGVEAGFKQVAKRSGVVEANIVSDIRGVQKKIGEGMGDLQIHLIDIGAVKPPPLGMGETKRALKAAGLDYKNVGGNEALQSDFTEILKGLNQFADPAERAKAIQSHPALEYFDLVRKTNASTGGKLGILDTTKINPDTYFPQVTPLIEIKPKFQQKLGSLPLDDVVGKVDTYRKALPDMAEGIRFSVDKAKIYNSELRAWQEYDDFMKLKTGEPHDKEMNKFLQGLVNRGDFDTVEAANAALQRDFRQEGKLGLTGRASSLDFNREVNLPWYDVNASRVMSTYAADSIKRFATASTFGALDQKLTKIINKVGKQELGTGKAAELEKDLEDLIRATFGTQKKDKGLEGLSRVMRATQTLKLSFSAIQNLAQTANTMLASDLGSTLKGMATAFSDENMRKTIKSGVVSENFLRQAFDYNSSGGKWADKFLKATGFTASEIINRSIASNVSNSWVEKNFQKLIKTYGKDWAAIEAKRPGQYWALKELGIDVKEAVKRGSLTPEDKVGAAFRFTERTQFTGNPLDLPYFASHPIGKVAMQFKSFAYQQSKFMIGDMVNQIERGNIKRVARNLFLLGTMYPMSDAVVRNVRSLITQEKAPDLTDLDTYINSIFSAGSFGIVADLWKSIEQDRGAEFFLGASSNDLLEYIQSSQKIVNFDSDTRDSGLKDFGKQLLKSSGAGRIPLNLIAPSKQPGESTLQKLF